MSHGNGAGDFFARKEGDGVNMRGDKLEDSVVKRDERKIRESHSGRLIVRTCPDSVSLGTLKSKLFGLLVGGDP